MVVRPVTVAELTVSSPLALIDKADAVEVAKVEGEDVAMYRMPPAFLKDQWLSPGIPSESVSCGRVDEATWSAHAGVEVPIPNRVLLPPFGMMALVNDPVEVAHLESGMLPVAQAAPVPLTSPPEMFRQPSAIPLMVAWPNVPAVAKRLVDEAVVAKKLVVVAELVVELTAVKF